MVHVHTTLTALHVPEKIAPTLSSLTDHVEQGQARSWAVADAPDDSTEGLLGQIVGLRLTVHAVRGR